jgi:hypothetical protein
VERLVSALAVVLFGAAACELAIALDWIEPGKASDAAAAVAAITLFVAAVTSVVGRLRGRLADVGPVLALLPLGAAAHIAALFYSYDSYFFPQHRRFSDGGNFSGTAIVVCVCILVAVAAAAALRPRAVAPVVVIALLVSVFFAALEADGH